MLPAYLAALARGLAAHALALPLEAIVVVLLPSLPGRGLIAGILAMMVVETVLLLVAMGRRGSGAPE